MPEPTYPSDRTDAESERIRPLLPAEKLLGKHREVDLRVGCERHFLPSRQREQMACLADQLPTLADGVWLLQSVGQIGSLGAD